MNSDDLKSLVIHTLLLSGLESKSERPMTHKEEKEALRLFSDPDCLDVTSFTLSKQKFEKGKLFSQKALEKFLYMIRLYVGGRILGNYEKTNTEPEVVRVTLAVEHLTHKQLEEQNDNFRTT